MNNYTLMRLDQIMFDDDDKELFIRNMVEWAPQNRKERLEFMQDELSIHGRFEIGVNLDDILNPEWLDHGTLPVFQGDFKPLEKPVIHPTADEEMGFQSALHPKEWIKTLADYLDDDDACMVYNVMAHLATNTISLV